MTSPFFASHSIFLTPAERKQLAKWPCIFETVGVTVWSSEKKYRPLREVLCHYLITNKDFGPPVELMPDGFKLYIGDVGECVQLLDPDEGGGAFMHYTVGCPVKKDGDILNVIHQVVIKDLTALETSMVCKRLAEALQTPVTALPDHSQSTTRSSNGSKGSP